MEKTLKNDLLTIKIDSHGAELCSIRHGNTEYLWQADTVFWARHSPVLFPIVGRVWENVFRIGGKEYSLPQHGFARDMEFRMTRQSEDSIWFSLEDSPETMEKYPFRFILEIGYRLSGRKIEVRWKVTNTGSGTMYFQIGAHPAFYFPDFKPETSDRGWFHFGGKTGMEYIMVKEKGCADPDSRFMLAMDGEYLPLDTHTFDKDALIIDNSQIRKVTLCRQDKTPWLSLDFDSPLVGLWSPPGKNAPFVCIEPWYGRCDRVGYTGEFSGKDWINSLEAGQVFNGIYTIEIHGND